MKTQVRLRVLQPMAVKRMVVLQGELNRIMSAVATGVGDERTAGRKEDEDRNMSQLAAGQEPD